MIGTVFDDFQIINKIGEGGMGSVYLAFQESLEREVALKVINKSSVANSELAVQRFLREAKIAASIQHPNVVHIYGIGETNGIFYISMEYIAGDTFDTISQQGPLEEIVLWEVAIQICEGLQAALAKNIIHRDIKPGNIMLKTEGLVKITDFGLSKKSDDNTRLTQEGTIIGTPDFMSPEQASGTDLDFRSDIYSLGATLYYLLTQKTLFTGTSPLDILIKHKSEKVLPPQTHISSISYKSSAVLGKMLQKQPQDRYQSYTQLIQDIEGIIFNTPLIFAKDPECFSVYTHIPDSAKRGLIRSVTEKFSLWVSGQSNTQTRKAKTIGFRSPKNKTETQQQQNSEIQRSNCKTIDLDYKNQDSQKQQVDHVSNDTLEVLKQAEQLLSESSVFSSKSSNKEGEKAMKIKDVLTDMTDELDEMMFVSVIGIDGIPIAQQSKSTINIDSFAAKFTMIMKLLQKSVKGLQNMGVFEENLVQADNAWILTRFLNDHYFLCIVINRDGVLGNARMVSQKYAESLKNCL